MRLDRTPVVMLVDDTPANLKLLDALLRNRGCDVRSFTGGAHALEAAAFAPPDILLLDIAMPEMDGFEVCRRLKANPALAAIPVIFLTALDATEDKLTAFQCGGVDYVTKPFQVEELWARVNTHLQLRLLTASLEEHNQALDQLVAARTEELAEAHRRLGVLDRAKSEFLKLISHELRTPLNGVLGIGDLLLDLCPPGSELDELGSMFQASRQRLMRLIENAEVLTQIEVGARNFSQQHVPLAPMLRIALEAVGGPGPRLEVTPPRLTVLGDEVLLAYAFRAVVNTAHKFASSPAAVSASCRAEGDFVTVEVDAAGVGVPEAALPGFFDVMGSSQPLTRGGDLGLDPSVAHRIFNLSGASLQVSNLQPPGLRLTARLPAAEPAP